MIEVRAKRPAGGTRRGGAWTGGGSRVLAAFFLAGLALADPGWAFTGRERKSEDREREAEKRRREQSREIRERWLKQSRKNQNEAGREKESAREKRAASAPLNLEQRRWLARRARRDLARAMRPLQKAGAVKGSGGPPGVRERPADFRAAYENGRKTLREISWFQMRRPGYRSQLDYEKFRGRYDYLLKQSAVAERFLRWAAPITRADQNWMRGPGGRRLKRVRAEFDKLKESPIPPPSGYFGGALDALPEFLRRWKRMLSYSLSSHTAGDFATLKKDLDKLAAEAKKVPAFMKAAAREHELNQIRDRIKEIYSQIQAIQREINSAPVFKRARIQRESVQTLKALSQELDELKAKLSDSR